MKSNTLPETGFVRLPVILEHIPVGRSTWWAKVKTGKYPQPVKLGPNTTAWKATEIHELIQKFNEAKVAKSIDHSDV